MALEFSDTGAGHTGAMIALIPAEQDAARLAMPGGEPVEELHVTLCYLGKAADYDTREQLALAAAVAQAAEFWAPVEAEAFAPAYFNPHAEDRETALVYLASGSDLHPAHERMTGIADLMFEGRVPKQHRPWVAHITAAYTDDLDAHRGLVGNLGRITFDRVRVAFGDQVYDIPLAVAVGADEPLGEIEPLGQGAEEPVPLGDVEFGEGDLGSGPAGFGHGEVPDDLQALRVQTDVYADACRVDVDMPGLVAAMGAYAPVRFRGPLAPIGSPTGDRRIFPPNTVTQAAFPQPLRFQRVGLEGHKGAVVVASITHAEEGTWEGTPHIVGEGYFLDPEIIPEVAEAIHLVENGVSGPSVDLDSFAATVGEYQGKPILVIQEARQRAATLVAIPAFADLRLQLEYPEEPAVDTTGMVAAAEYFTRRAENDVQVELEYELWHADHPDANADARFETRQRLICVTNFTNTTDALREGITLLQLADATYGASLGDYPDIIDRVRREHGGGLAAATEWCRADGTLDLNALAADADPANISPEVREFMSQSILDGLMIHRPGEEPRRVQFATTTTNNWDSAPIAPRSSTFDADDAVKRIQAWAGIGTEDEDEAAFRSMFLWAKPEQLDQDNVPLGSAGYRLPWGDIFDGKPYLVYHAVYAASALLEGGHGGLPNIPDTDKAKLRNTITKIYSRFSEAFDDPNVRASWDAREEASAMELETFAAKFGTLYPSKRAFGRRDLKRPTKPVVSADGTEYYGHLALWGTCHLGHSGSGVCQKPVHSRVDYKHFYTGTVQTSEGEIVEVGKIMGDGGHAATRRGMSASAVKKYYEDTSKVFGLVRLYKDRFGIQFSGVPAPWATEELAQKMRASEISAHWHPIDNHLEVVAAIAVNRPAFGITASAALEDLVVDDSTIVLVEDGVQTGLIASAQFDTEKENTMAVGGDEEDCGCGTGSKEAELRAARIMQLEPIPTHAELAARQARLSRHLGA